MVKVSVTTTMELEDKNYLKSQNILVCMALKNYVNQLREQNINKEVAGSNQETGSKLYQVDFYDFQEILNHACKNPKNWCVT